MQPAVDGQNLSILSGMQAVHSQLSSTIQGSYKGQAVAVIPGGGTASLQDALEELTFTFSESVSKKLADRTKQSKSFSARLHALLQKYVTAIPDSLSPDELNQYADWLRRQAQPKATDLKQRFSQQFGDNTEAKISTIEFLEELFSKEDHPQAAEAIKDLKNQWRTDEIMGPPLRAGENIQGQVDQYGELIDTDIGLRNFYRETVLAWDNLDAAYDAILAKYADSFTTASEFLISALGCEMQAIGPSCDPRFLQAVRDNIYYIQVMRRLHEQVSELAERLRDTYGIELCKSEKKTRRRRKSSGRSSR